MGDYNLNIFTPNVQTEAKNCYLSTMYSYTDGCKKVSVLTVQDQLTTLKSSEDNGVLDNALEQNLRLANNYDHFTYSPESFPSVRVRFRTIDAIEKYCRGNRNYYKQNISDHLPIMMTLDI